MTEQIFNVENMSCQHCVLTVKKELSKLNLDNVQVELGIVKIYYDETKISIDRIEKAIEEAGYKVRKD